LKKKKAAKTKLLKLIEFSTVYTLLSVVRIIPMTCIRVISSMLGALFFSLSSKRRNIAIGNIAAAFGDDKTAAETRKIAKDSFRSFFLTFLEIIKFQHLFDSEDAADRIRNSADSLESLFQKAKAAHDESKGCIFVTPHIGNWEVLPHVSRLVGIPLVVVARPLDNEYLNDLLLKKRAASGQIIMPKRNSFFALQETLKKGKSIGLLPDQSTMKGIFVDFFGRKATTTPVPALLAISHMRPIVVVACCRKERGQFEGFVCDPIWPKDFESEKAEIFRLTQEMNRNMELIIRKYPGQYLWMHNRWKTYKNKKEFYS
jgi:Kdo2-lipid IVA lauroyltransferase/acyltransferase